MKMTPALLVMRRSSGRMAAARELRKPSDGAGR